jgi:HK97 gp10 family phage protein
MPKSFEVVNPDALAKEIKKLERATSESVLRKAAAAGATVIKNEIAGRTPVDTGDLLNGLTVAYAPEASVTGSIATYVVTFVGTAPDQKNGKPGMRRRHVAGWLEYGTSKMAARPFIRAGFDAKKTQAAQATQKVIEDEINKENS